MTKKENMTIWYVALAAVVLIVLLNQYQMTKLTYSIKNLPVNTGTQSQSTGAVAAVSGVIPTGVPAIYGAELGVSYDDISPNDQQRADAAIRKLAMLDTSIELSGADLERYIAIGSKISCEYCCGAESIIFSNGQPACGCAHSYAMRGVAKYLITKHGSEYTDDQILEELGKWKTLFFPGVLTAKAQVLQQQGIEFNYINLASNKYRNIEKGASASGGMVGGC